ncbi:hypothetical protein [Corynebacterium pygosceleis]|uniref:PaaI family thioesterase n=1 Tax=Corynebacterium pygosceleis TaxID=2800406 RepID=A0A9Q4GKZ0_9CORY|nr:hypothetical protein [Corynebacterium pygosceleis]MCK7637101.1 hypothetical protein [Corynebacterium pygosceleis]MCK7674575.1 hypothetical protein [Corynebacterium pygosceleis]MCL0120123.1 hypothetical protein [Corynebacterium pygosceleis]MCX7443671.1 hypothetical protein [Corynebacterium pygosceleis]MCX7467855.1 hypothetical protein [Corynebacterium pygosceleis]
MDASNLSLRQLLDLAADRPLHMRELARFADLNDGIDRLLGLRYLEITPDGVRAEMHINSDHLDCGGNSVSRAVCLAVAESVGSVTAAVAARGNPINVAHVSGEFCRNIAAGVVEITGTFINEGDSVALVDVSVTNRGELILRSTQRSVRATTSPSAH